MPTSASPSRLRLVADTLRAHRTGIILWVAVGAVTQIATAGMLAQTFKSTAGGGAAIAPGVEAAAQALRILRWPAERLDTLGGYLTYHNILLLPLILGLYAAIAGAQAIRGAEAGGSLEELLATGWRRVAVLRDRAFGFLIGSVLIALGLGAGTAIGLAAGGEPDTIGSFVTVAEATLCAFAFFALAVLVAQLTRTARTAAGITALVMTALYVFTNVWDKAGPFAVARFISPFFYFQQSRALLPGHPFDLAATLALMVMPVVILGVAAWAFERRDYGSVLGVRPRTESARRPVTVARPWLAAFWCSSLVRQRYGLLAWAVGTAAMAGLVSYLEPEVRKLWTDIEYIRRFIATSGGASLTDQYLSFAAALLAPVAAAYVTTQVASWISDLRQGRVELLLSSPVAWTRLVVERLIALAAGIAVITGAAIIGLVVGAIAAGVPLRSDGLVRLTGDSVLFGLALGGVGAMLAALLRTSLATALLAVFLIVTYLVDLLAPVYEWPSWIGNLSVFDAFGQPYVGVPPLFGLALLAALALLGAGAAAWLSERSPKV
ncbi:MAG TPA: ABC transporter permease subunit, partial [Candidatus Dormibacteraeota bacterium]|nr:ABC transporter permease subunit [Candidatus Dormibacteraeota bacterium]